jgi:ubiquinone/menaquinone biosynthesis C-methylase UbiE
MGSKQEEQEFHDRFVTTGDVRVLESKFYSTLAEDNENRLAIDYLGDMTGKRLLFYGSGGHFSLVADFVRRGASVVAIDISPQTVAGLQGAIERRGIAPQAAALVMDCESLQFEANSFDFIFARSIVHHLDTEISLREMNRVLKPGGKLTVFEPLGTNPIINLYRHFTPESRTTGEHPFVARDLNAFRRYFPNMTLHYLYFLSIGAYVYRMVDRNEKRFASVFRALSAVDRGLLRILPGYRLLCWDVLICCTKSA